jgi:hypothetical protein
MFSVLFFRGTNALLAFTQDQKRRKREQERRTNAAKKLREAAKGPDEEKPEEEEKATASLFALEVDEGTEEKLTDEEKQQKIRGHSQVIFFSYLIWLALQR